MSTDKIIKYHIDLRHLRAIPSTKFILQLSCCNESFSTKSAVEPLF